MRIVKTTAAMQRLAKRWRGEKCRVGLVPTMGYLHAGHLSLVHRARQLVGPAGIVVASIYVNPAQFGPGEDLSRYPRDLGRDLQQCRAAGVDVVFVPDDAQMYPRHATGARTWVVEEQLSRPMEGAARPTHFRGVTTVVAKLFNLVLPDFAVFGAKDFQQAAVIRRMTAELDFPIKIIVAPIVREPDGLALSSRNKYLQGGEREEALALRQALALAAATVKKRRLISARELKRAVTRLLARQPHARLDYVEFFDPETLVPVTTVRRGTQMALAVFIGKTRLIDNLRL